MARRVDSCAGTNLWTVDDLRDRLASDRARVLGRHILTGYRSAREHIRARQIGSYSGGIFFR